MRPLVLGAVALVCLLGCESGPKLYPVRGKVTLPDGKPVHAGTVTFYPDAARGNTSLDLPIGELKADGTYALASGPKPGATAGWYKVAVNAAERVNPNDPYRFTWIGHERYTNPDAAGLAVEVVESPGPTQYDLTIEPPAAPVAKKGKK